MNRWVTALLSGVVLAVTGCGGGAEEDERYELNRSPELAHAQSLRGLITSLVESYQNEGLPALRTEMSVVFENFDPLKEAASGDQNRQVYEEAEQKLKELQSLVEGSAGREQIVAKLKELSDLTQRLPQPPPAQPAAAP
jgi:hypothetical protein